MTVEGSALNGMSVLPLLPRLKEHHTRRGEKEEEPVEKKERFAVFWTRRGCASALTAAVVPTKPCPNAAF